MSEANDHTAENITVKKITHEDITKLLLIADPFFTERNVLDFQNQRKRIKEDLGRRIDVRDEKGQRFITNLEVQSYDENMIFMALTDQGWATQEMAREFNIHLRNMHWNGWSSSYAIPRQAVVISAAGVEPVIIKEELGAQPDLADMTPVNSDVTPIRHGTNHGDEGEASGDTLFREHQHTERGSSPYKAATVIAVVVLILAFGTIWFLTWRSKIEKKTVTASGAPTVTFAPKASSAASLPLPKDLILGAISDAKVDAKFADTNARVDKVEKDVDALKSDVKAVTKKVDALKPAPKVVRVSSPASRTANCRPSALVWSYQAGNPSSKPVLEHCK